MLKLSSIMIGCENIDVMAEFYKQLFGKDADMSDGGYFGWDTNGAFFTIGAHSEIHGQSKEPARIMFNLDAKDVQAEFDRLKDIVGIKVIKAPYQMGEGDMVATIATLADPEGNYFQLMTPWEGK